MPETVAERTQYGYEVIEDAMEMLVTIYNNIPKEELNDTPVSFTSGRVCEILEMFFMYVHEAEGIDVEGLMGSVSMELSSTVAILNDEDPKIH